MSDDLYLDANATEPLRPEARAAVLVALDLRGNPSSVHADGRAARRVLETARSQIANAFGARAQDVVLTAGGTEANAAAIHALAPGRAVLVGATEHPAVLAATPGATPIPVLADGRLDLAALDTLLTCSDLALVCVMAANNETGVLHPLSEIAALCRRHGALLHIDAVQAAGRMALDFAGLGADTMALSGHKLGGPKGAGALLLRPGLTLAPLLAGGGQERGRRGGTEALPAIAGMGAAAAAARPQDAARLGRLRDAIEAGAGLSVAGQGAPRLPNTTSLIFPRMPAETLVIALDLEGVRVSAGSACSSGKVTRSHVLTAMGLGEAAGHAIRVSLPWDAPEDVAPRFLAALARVGARLAPVAGPSTGG
ncbi:cysteine desulfurase [Humitalea rosea]|uniref:Cysteine desulfurase n=1 Tax=Humitalea rosea TaxID=990373 RepID=A0A2W7IDI3_9PROT|nr:aminotransferase class V-fold PLP-dependent enzyme [Humitalea rosea]PZW44794.1 cysteine desulfurase [Humitalea rosea]